MTTLLERKTSATEARVSDTSTRPTSVDRPSTEPSAPTTASTRSIRSRWRTWARSRRGTAVDVRLVEESRHRAHLQGVWHLG